MQFFGPQRVKSWQSIKKRVKKTEANIVLLNYVLCLFMCVTQTKTSV